MSSRSSVSASLHYSGTAVYLVPYAAIWLRLIEVVSHNDRVMAQPMGREFTDSHAYIR